MKGIIKGYLYFVNVFAVFAGIIALLISIGPFRDFYYYMMQIPCPNYSSIMKKKYAEKSNEYLLKKINSWSEDEKYYASSELEKRKDKGLIPLYNKMLNSGNKNEKDVALSALVNLNEPTVIPALLDMVEKKKDFWSYKRGVKSLVLMKYEPIIPEIKKLAEMPVTKEYGEIPQDNAIEMCKIFGNNPKTIEILKIVAAQKPANPKLAWLSSSKEAKAALKQITGKDYVGS